MADRRPRLSLRWQLAIGIAVVLLLVEGATFVAVYRGTGAELRAQIDRELRNDADGFSRRGIPRGATPRQALAVARRYVDAQPFRASARLYFATIPGPGVATNEPELLGLTHEPDEPATRQADEKRQALALRRARPGLSTVRLGDVGHLRLYVQRVSLKGQRPATIGVGEPLRPAERAQADVAGTFAIAGTATLVAALLVSYLMSTRLTRPLRRMATVAARVDAGDLSPRIATTHTRDEIGVLASAFDRMLDRLDDAFSRQRAFVSDASHELRTPLTIIRGQLEVLARQANHTAADVHRVERLVQTEVARMEHLVDDLLILARADEGQFVNTQEIDVEHYLRQLFERTHNTADRRFETAAMPAGRLLADPDKLAQALRNLFANAIEHTEPGGLVRLTARARNRCLIITVEDDGPGIPVQERERVFDRFYRTDASHSRRTGGTGLGLPIVRAIIEGHDGTVEIHPRSGGGTSVRITLPRFVALLSSETTGASRATPAG